MRKADPSVSIVFINGARTQNLLVGTEGVEEMGATLISCTDDGTCGVRGRVTVPLGEMLGEGVPTAVYTCGPTPMMQAVAEACLAADVSCLVPRSPIC